jgi:immunoglobulin-like protein involved in spore germination/sporulation and spore germination protein
MNCPRTSVFVPIAIVLAALVGGCSPSGGLGTVPPAISTPSPSVGTSDPDTTPVPTSGAPASPTAPSASPGASAPSGPDDTTIVRSYFYLGGEPGTAGLVPVLREVPHTVAVGGAAMNALLSGPTTAESGDRRISSAIPAGSKLLDLSIADGIATVDLSSEFESGGGSASVITRLGQVVYTLTQYPAVQSVLFKIGGRVVTVFSSEGIVLDGPVGRDNFQDLLPAIFVDRPAFEATIGNPARIAGSASVFEATFLITILDGSGTVIGQTQAMATCGTGCRGTFDVTLPYAPTEAGWGTLRVWDGSAKDGSPENVREYPVWLTPAG